MTGNYRFKSYFITFRFTKRIFIRNLVDLSLYSCTLIFSVLPKPIKIQVNVKNNVIYSTSNLNPSYLRSSIRGMPRGGIEGGLPRGGGGMQRGGVEEGIMGMERGARIDEGYQKGRGERYIRRKRARDDKS